MKNFIQTLFILLVFTSFSSVAGADEASAQVVKDVLDLGQLPTGRLAKVTMWYPAGTCTTLSPQLHCLADSAITNKTIVLSHGAMGAAENYNWIAEPLAAAGYVVLGINHFGESWLYGQDTQDVKATAFLWQRPMDISAIYDALSNRDIFQKSISWSNVVAIGHSSGGVTVAMLSGIKYDLLQVIDFCKTETAQGDHSCDYGIRNTPKPGESFLTKFGADYTDKRIKKIIMIDPTLGYGATLDSMTAVLVPTFIIGALHNDFLPWDNHGARYAKKFPNSKIHLLSGQEGHFVFLDTCDNDILVMGVALCTDRTGVDRAATHAQLIPKIIEFVAENNITLDEPQKFAVQKSPLFNLEKITQFFIYTPHWVFGLLAGLVVLGLLQLRTRQIPTRVAFIMPVAMLMMSLTGTLMDLGVTWATISSWTLGASLITLLLLKLQKSSATYDLETHRFSLQGSWVPLLVIMIIFCTRYALSTTIAMQLPIMQKIYFAPVMSFILGGLSGYFIAQGFRYLQIARDTGKSAVVV